MKTRSNLAALGIAGALAMTSALSPALAAGGAPAPAAAAAPAAPAVLPGKAVIETSQDVGKAMRESRAARVALFEGETDMAAQHAGDAQASFEAAAREAARYSVPNADAGDRYVPFDVQIGLAEDFRPTEDTVDDLRVARDHMMKGDQKAAAEVLRKADIAVTVAAAVMPVDAAVAHVRKAVALIDEQKFYEANLALKAVEDAVTVETYAAGALPTQGGAG
ncbi:MAG: hypothetical protein AcusKO_01980 [Acuticoccus sp.]